jgi:hypothetical protein
VVDKGAVVWLNESMTTTQELIHQVAERYDEWSDEQDEIHQWTLEAQRLDESPDPYVDNDFDLINVFAGYASGARTRVVSDLIAAGVLIPSDRGDANHYQLA